MVRISSVRDIETYVDNECPDVVACGLRDQVVEALRSQVHPVWGSDWGPWLADVGPATVASVSEEQGAKS